MQEEVSEEEIRNAEEEEEQGEAAEWQEATSTNTLL